MRALILNGSKQVTDKGREQVHGLSQLETLDITGRTNVTAAGIEAVRRALPETNIYSYIATPPSGGKRNPGGP